MDFIKPFENLIINAFVLISIIIINIAFIKLFEKLIIIITTIISNFFFQIVFLIIILIMIIV